MQYYPMMLNLNGKDVVVVGGGKVAERKVQGLLDAGAIVTVISIDVTAGLIQLEQQKTIQVKKRRFVAEDVKEAFLIVAATNDKETNLAVHRAAGQNKLINVVDSPEISNFHVPSVIRRGKLVLSVSTSGASPKLAKKIRTELEEKYDERYIDYIDFLYDWRKRIISTITSPRLKNELLEELINSSYIDDKDRKKRFAGHYNKYMMP